MTQSPSFYHNLLPSKMQNITTTEYFATKEDAEKRIKSQYSNYISKRLTVIPEKDCSNIEVIQVDWNNRKEYILILNIYYKKKFEKRYDVFSLNGGLCVRHTFSLSDLSNMPYRVSKNFQHLFR